MSDPSPIVSQLNMNESDSKIFESDAITPGNKKVRNSADTEFLFIF